MDDLALSSIARPYVNHDRLMFNTRPAPPTHSESNYPKLATVACCAFSVDLRALQTVFNGFTERYLPLLSPAATGLEIYNSNIQHRSTLCNRSGQRSMMHSRMSEPAHSSQIIGACKPQLLREHHIMLPDEEAAENNIQDGVVDWHQMLP